MTIEEIIAYVRDCARSHVGDADWIRYNIIVGMLGEFTADTRAEEMIRWIRQREAHCKERDEALRDEYWLGAKMTCLHFLNAFCPVPRHERVLSPWQSYTKFVEGMTHG